MVKKKIVSLTVASACVLTVCASAAFVANAEVDQTKPTYNVDTVVNDDGTATTTVTFTRPEDVAAGNFTLTYDTAALKLKSADKGAAADTADNLLVNNSEEGTVKANFYYLNGYVENTSTEVAVITYDVIAEDIAEDAIKVEAFKFYDINSAKICDEADQEVVYTLTKPEPKIELDETQPYYTVSTAIAEDGTVVASVVFANPDNAAAASNFFIEYDQDLLTVADVTKGSVASEADTFTLNDKAAGQFRGNFFYLEGFTDDKSTDVLTITFAPIAEDVTADQVQDALQLSEFKFYDVNSALINDQTTQAVNYIIGDARVTEESSDEESSEQSQEESSEQSQDEQSQEEQSTEQSKDEQSTEQSKDETSKAADNSDTSTTNNGGTTTDTSTTGGDGTVQTGDATATTAAIAMVALFAAAGAIVLLKGKKRSHN